MTILNQIAELTIKEQQHFHVWMNEYLGQQLAAQKRQKIVMCERTNLELETEKENKNESK